MKHRVARWMVVVVAMLATAGTAFASNGGSLIAGYGGQTSPAAQVKTPKSAPTKPNRKPKSPTFRAPATSARPTTQPKKSSGTLPFTGFDLGIAALCGLLLLLLGFALRRTARKSS